MHTSNTCLLFNRSNQWQIQDFCKGEGGTSATGALAWVPAVGRAAATGSGRSLKAPQTVLGWVHDGVTFRSRANEKVRVNG